MRAVVTGSTRGLGEAIARDLASRGWTVTVNGTNVERCEALARELGGRAVAGSVADEWIAEQLAEGGVDLLVNNAGNTRDGMLSRLTVQAFDEVIAVHLRGSWLAARACAREMRRSSGGMIINVVSGTALFGSAAQSNYAAAKGGLLAMTRALSLELASAGIRVNAVSPTVRTSMIDPLIALAGDAADELLELFGTPAEVAPVVSALAATTMTGQIVGFDGRRLRLWSHPEILREDRQDAWDDDSLATALTGEPAELHPDELGVAVQQLMGTDIRERTR